jgi:hypothetical protein
MCCAAVSARVCSQPFHAELIIRYETDAQKTPLPTVLLLGACSLPQESLPSNGNGIHIQTDSKGYHLRVVLLANDKGSGPPHRDVSNQIMKFPWG